MINLSEDDIRAIAARIVRYTGVAGTTDGGHGDSVEGETADDGQTYDLGVRRMFPWGFDSRPPAGVEAVVVFNRGGASNGMMVGNGRDGNGPALDDGEVAIFSKAVGAYVKIYKDGAITATNGSGGTLALDKDGNISATAATGKDVIVNGGGAKVARVGDHTTAHTHTVTYTLTAPPGGGAVTGTITLANANPTIAEGADHFKA